MDLREDRPVSVPAGVLSHELPDRECVALNLQTEQYHGFDHVGSAMWRALGEARTVEGACRRLLGQFNVEPAVLRDDLSAFVTELAERGLLVVDGD